MEFAVLGAFSVVLRTVGDALGLLFAPLVVLFGALGAGQRTNQPTNQPTDQPTRQPTNQSINQSINRIIQLIARLKDRSIDD